MTYGYLEQQQTYWLMCSLGHARNYSEEASDRVSSNCYFRRKPARFTLTDERADKLTSRVILGPSLVCRRWCLCTSFADLTMRN